MNTSKLLLLVSGIITGFFFLTNTSFAQADLVLKNGIVATLEPTNSIVEAVAIKNGKILFTGNNKEIDKYVGRSTQVIDLNGKFVMPGFIESHAHFVGLGESLINLDLRSAKNRNEVVELVSARVKKIKPGEWIIGRGWHQEKFNPAPSPNVNGYPVHDLLSAATPDNPVMLSHASGHAIFTNAKAMQLALVTNATPDPAGGTIVRDEKGNAIGVFEENAESIIKRVYEYQLSKRTSLEVRDDYIKSISLATEECLKKGITSVHDAGEPFEIIDVMKQLANSNKLMIRLNVMVGDTYEKMKSSLAKYKISEMENKFLRVKSIKQYMDGALGSRGAWLLKPYSDLPNHLGSNVTPIEELNKICELAIENDFQMRIHAIGDKANREVLNLYENIYSLYPEKKNLRWCIEHAQHLSEQDIPRFAKLGIIAAMQPVHCTSDMGFVPTRLGNDRTKEGAYVWKKLINSGAIICSGTDSPVEDVDPIKNFYAAVTRKNENGKEFYPDQKMTRLEALQSYTIYGAFASCEENEKGSIKNGKFADLTVLSNDLLSCNEDELLKTKIVYTIVNGKILYDASNK